jgi:hypothetical protein
MTEKGDGAMFGRPLFVGLLLVALAGCAAPRQAQILDPQFADRSLGVVALAPVVFADEAIDRYFGAQAAESIRQEAAEALKRKGYQVTFVGNGPYFAGPPIVPAAADMARLAPAAPPGSDAVMQIRVDHFLDSGLYDERTNAPLDIYATAAMIGAKGEIFWQGSGRGEGMRQSSQGRIFEFLPVTSRLADSLFATLPAAP